MDSKRRLYSRVLQTSFENSQISVDRWANMKEVIKLNSQDVNQRDQKVSEIFAACPPLRRPLIAGSLHPKCSEIKEKVFDPDLEKPASVVQALIQFFQKLKKVHASKLQRAKEEGPTKDKDKKIIICGGFTISEQKIIELRELFATLADGEEGITLETFQRSAGQQSFIRKVSVSVFNRLDPKGRGLISFTDLLYSLYPILKREPAARGTVFEWIRGVLDAERIFDIGNSLNRNSFGETLSFETISGLFKALDEEKKGYLSVGNMVKVIGPNVRDRFEELAPNGKLSMPLFHKLLKTKYFLTQSQFAALFANAKLPFPK